MDRQTLRGWVHRCSADGLAGLSDRHGASVFRDGLAALASAVLPDAVRAANTPVEVWRQDEARVGQQGTLTYVWAEKAAGQLLCATSAASRHSCLAPCAPAVAQAPP